jgi:hypothetical protein
MNESVVVASTALEGRMLECMSNILCNVSINIYRTQISNGRFANASANPNQEKDVDKLTDTSTVHTYTVRVDW